MRAYSGLTWNHPRGFRALDASAQRWRSDSFEIHWERQSLEQFEARPIAEICSHYDLVVLDHPHVGEAVKAGCLAPLEEWCLPEEVTQLQEDSIGRTLPSYSYDGQHWALPLDAAAQVLAFRADLVPQDCRLTFWKDIRELSKGASVILSLAGPHALLTFFSICVALGEVPVSRDSTVLISPAIGERALDLMASLFAEANPSMFDRNPITILDSMATSDSIVCCPLIYGYVNYAVSDDPARRAITFANAPRLETIGVPGSTLGGTGIAVSRRAKLTAQLKAYLLWLVNPETQRTFITHWDGQPSSRTAWLDKEVDRRWNGFYLKTTETIEQAWIRPRFPGYIKFQTEASELLRSGLKSRLRASRVLTHLQHLFEACYSNYSRSYA
jgi:multiple sugar transport system substrate-binding protein